jgi:bifunctional DNA-binding transcriptional regulator/antitoxin component of YhaV-PrlF toxin-antitoxin module
MDRYKTVKEKKDLYIEFSEEEIKELGWKENQKLSIDLEGDGIIIKPWVTMEIDTSNWPKEIFQLLVDLSLEQDKTVNDVIVDLITKSLDKGLGKEELICE